MLLQMSNTSPRKWKAVRLKCSVVIPTCVRAMGIDYQWTSLNSSGFDVPSKLNVGHHTILYDED